MPESWRRDGENSEKTAKKRAKRVRIADPLLMDRYYSLVRAATKTLSWLCCIVFAASLIDPTGQAVHDTLSGTLVVRKPRRGEVHLPGGLGVALRDDGVFLRRPAPAGGDRAGRND